MADEITTELSFTIEKNGRARTVQVGSQTFDMTGNVQVDAVQSIGFAAHEALALGEVTAPGLAYFHNLDDTNFIQVGYDATGTFRPFIKLLPGQEALVWLDSAMAAPYAKADTGAVLLDYVLAQA